MEPEMQVFLIIVGSFIQCIVNPFTWPIFIISYFLVFIVAPKKIPTIFKIIISLILGLLFYIFVYEPLFYSKHF